MGPPLEISTVGWSSTQNNTLGFTENNWAPTGVIYCRLVKYTTTHCRFYREQLGPTLKLSTVGWSSRHNNTLQVLQRTIGPPTEVIYCRLFKYIQQHTAVLQRTIGSSLKISTVGCSNTHNNTLQFYREQVGPALPKGSPDVRFII